MRIGTRKLTSESKYDNQFHTLNMIDKLFYLELKKRNKILKEKNKDNIQKIKRIDIKIAC